jgi:1-aminocyclopropane-1-carboxylate deaminase/D-cysteine desulfhydrase-like pyridoxal-dependent ACC family enzyme
MPAEGYAFRVCWNDELHLTHERLTELLRVFGDLLPHPLSQKMDLDEYAAKLLQRAEMAFAIHRTEIVGMMALYANDHESHTAHVPFAAVLPAHRGRGVYKAMVCRVIAKARQRGMQRLWCEIERDTADAQHVWFSLGARRTADRVSKIVVEIDLTASFDLLERRTTPVESGGRLAAVLGLDIDFRIKRDDLYPLYGGGVKARKACYIVREAIAEGYDVLVTNGGPQSNHARATAVLAAALGLRCHLVIVLDPETRYSMSGNILLMRMSGATIEYCTKDQLAARMDRAVSALEDKGHRPLYIWGGGHCLQGTVAFVEAAAEARQQCGEWIPDYLVLASATGSTQAGLAIGYADLPTRVVGISVARETKRGGRIVGECIDEYLAAHNRVGEPIKVIFHDDWTDGGYELYSPELFSLIDQAAKAGHFFDPTYSGKGLRGLLSMVRRGDIPPGSRVLFWHTGGLLNLQANLNYTEGEIRL